MNNDLPDTFSDWTESKFFLSSLKEVSQCCFIFWGLFRCLTIEAEFGLTCPLHAGKIFEALSSLGQLPWRNQWPIDAVEAALWPAPAILVPRAQTEMLVKETL